MRLINKKNKRVSRLITLRRLNPGERVRDTDYQYSNKWPTDTDVLSCDITVAAWPNSRTPRILTNRGTYGHGGNYIFRKITPKAIGEERISWYNQFAVRWVKSSPR